MAVIQNPLIRALKHQLNSVFKGSQEAIDNLIAALICEGHVLLEDVPGLGKTTLAKSLAKSLALSFKRVQCTPDLMPMDVLGGNIYQPDTQTFNFVPGPIFANFVLVDEINRASPRTQSAFLEAMAEGTVTIDRKTASLPKPFMVIATQNPVEYAGTFPLPEAQLDRFFMRLSLGYPDTEQTLAIMALHLQGSQSQSQILANVRSIVSKDQLRQWQEECCAVEISGDVQDYIVAIIEATRAHKDVRLGASPRAAIALMHAARAKAYLDGQHYVTPHHVQATASAVLGHRLILRGSQSIQNSQKVIAEILSLVTVKAVAEPLAQPVSASN